MADAQADLSLRWAHTHFVGFLMLWLIMKFVIASHKIYISYQYIFGIHSNVLYISKVLEVVRNGKNGIHFVTIQAEININSIPLPKKDKILVLVKSSRLAIFMH